MASPIFHQQQTKHSQEQPTIMPDGCGVYEDEWIDGKKQDKGVAVDRNGGRYEGDFLNNQYHGQGRYTWVKGDIYEGEWVDGEEHGKGELVFVSGNRYEGDFYDGKYHGQGKYTWADGDIYEGEWVDGKKHGKGVLVFVSGNRYEGDFYNDKFHGHGKYTYIKGSTYDGKYFNRHGCEEDRECRWAVDGVYEGEWVDGKKQGKGSFVDKGGERYEGDFYDDHSQGHGKYMWPDGSIYEGEFHHGVRHGKGRYVGSSGYIVDGMWSNDKSTNYFLVNIFRSLPSMCINICSDPSARGPCKSSNVSCKK